MGAPEIIAALAILLVLFGAIFYIIRQKRRGVRCIGCPKGNSCSGACGGSCACKQKTEKEEKK